MITACFLFLFPAPLRVEEPKSATTPRPTSPDNTRFIPGRIAVIHVKAGGEALPALVALSESGNRASSVNETPGMGPG
jgi:hypothetical protein